MTWPSSTWQDKQSNVFKTSVLFIEHIKVLKFDIILQNWRQNIQIEFFFKPIRWLDLPVHDLNKYRLKINNQMSLKHQFYSLNILKYSNLILFYRTGAKIFKLNSKWRFPKKQKNNRHSKSCQSRRSIEESRFLIAKVEKKKLQKGPMTTDQASANKPDMQMICKWAMRPDRSLIGNRIIRPKSSENPNQLRRYPLSIWLFNRIVTEL